jgi:hypothetical protein
MNDHSRTDEASGYLGLEGQSESMGMPHGLGDDCYSQLTKPELVKILEFVEQTLVITTQSELASLLLEIRKLVPCDYIVSGLARTDDRGQFLGPLQTVNACYPQDWFHRYMDANYAAVDAVLRTNFSRYKTQVWSETFKQARSRREREFIGEAAAFDLKQGLTLVVKCPSQPVGRVFSFSGRNIADHHRHAVLLQRLVPICTKHCCVSHFYRPPPTRSSQAESGKCCSGSKKARPTGKYPKFFGSVSRP